MSDFFKDCRTLRSEYVVSNAQKINAKIINDFSCNALNYVTIMDIFRLIVWQNIDFRQDSSFNLSGKDYEIPTFGEMPNGTEIIIKDSQLTYIKNSQKSFEKRATQIYLTDMPDGEFVIMSNVMSMPDAVKNGYIKFDYNSGKDSIEYSYVQTFSDKNLTSVYYYTTKILIKFDVIKYFLTRYRFITGYNLNELDMTLDLLRIVFEVDRDV